MPNIPTNIDCALAFNDQYSGSQRVLHTTDLVHTRDERNELSDLAQSGMNRTEFFDKLNLQVEQQPYTLTASGTLQIIVHKFD